jgi:hypothetical protein
MSRSLLTKTSALKNERQVAGSVVGSSGDTTSLQVAGAGAQTQTIRYQSMTTSTVITFIAGADSGDTKTLTIALDGTTGASDSAAASHVADEINAATSISNLMNASATTDTVTLTGRQKGASATFYATSSATAGTVTVNTAVDPTDATAIRPGAMCEESSSTKVQGVELVAASVGTATYAAGVYTVVANGGDITLGASDRISATVSIDVDGNGPQDFGAEVTWSSDLATTLGNLVGNLNAKLAGLVTVAIASTNNLTFTGATAGYTFNVVASYYDSSATTYAAYTVTETTATNCFGAGVAVFSQTVEQDSSGRLVFGTGAELSALTSGRIHALLDSGVSVAKGDPVFVRVTTSGTEIAGAMRGSKDGTDCLPISSYGFVGRFDGDNFTSMDGDNVAPVVLTRGN